MISTDEDLLNAGVALMRLSSDEASLRSAERLFRSSLEINPQNWSAAHNIGTLLMVNTPEQAMPFLLSATTLNPKSGNSWAMLSKCQCTINRFEEAYASASMAVAVAPDSAELWYHLAGTCERMEWYTEAVTHYKMSLKLAPNNIDAQYALGMTKMLLGDYKEGLPLYEARLKGNHKGTPIQARPVVEIQKLAAISKIKDAKISEIVIEYEQGVGDLFQMIRYAESVSKALGCKVTLRCPSGLVPIMRKVIGLGEVLTDTQEIRDQLGRYHVSMMSLPYLAILLGLDIFQPPARLIPSIRTVATYPRIGLCWKGNPEHAKDRFRSMPLEKMLMVQPVHQVDLCSLQYGEDDNELVKKSMRTGLSGDWIKTAREMTSLDLVVTVDTATAHLTGTLGKKTLLLLARDPDWRWGLGPTQRWYPSVEIIRQTKLGEWDDVIERAARRVIELTAEEQ